MVLIVFDYHFNNKILCAQFKGQSHRTYKSSKINLCSDPVKIYGGVCGYVRDEMRHCVTTSTKQFVSIVLSSWSAENRLVLRQNE